MKYANISIERGYSQKYGRGKETERTINLGDDIQILAIDNLYRYMGIEEEDIVRIEYYDLVDYDGEYLILPVNFIYFNADYGERDLYFSPKIIPVFLGIQSQSLHLNEKELKYLERFAPIGCREEQTLRYLQCNNIDAYLQGCLTATFPKRPAKEGYDSIFLVDIPEQLRNFLPENIAREGIEISQQFYGNVDAFLRENAYDSVREYVQDRLKLYYDKAKLVITSRLHCAAPCVAMGIPVILVCEKISSNLAWLDKLIPIYTYDDFANIDWGGHCADYEPMKKRLLEYAAQRITSTWNKYSEMLSISEFYENRSAYKYENVYLWSVKKFMEENQNKQKSIKYGLWGVTDIADEVYTFMLENYPEVKLEVVIDDFRKLNYKGLTSVTSDEIIYHSDCVFFATGNSSGIAAGKKFRELYGEKADEHYCAVFRKSYVDIQ